jgi:RNA-binding motif protein, X-linked 2
MPACSVDINRCDVVKLVQLILVSTCFGSRTKQTKRANSQQSRPLRTPQMNSVKEILKINDLELNRGLSGTPGSWHSKYQQSAWVYLGNLDHSLSEGDVICVLSQYGEVQDIHLVREQDTGQSKGFCFVKYEDARSCVLAVDNLIGVPLLDRSLRIDHVENYRLPRHLMEKEEEEERRNHTNSVHDNHNKNTSNILAQPGLAYLGQDLSNDFSLERGQDLFAPVVRSNNDADNNNNNNQRTQEELVLLSRSEQRAALKQTKRIRKQERLERREKKGHGRHHYDNDHERDERRRSKRAKTIKEAG